MDPTVLVQVAFYLTKILRLGTVSGVFNSIQDKAQKLVQREEPVVIRPTRLQGAGR
ncbi:MAG: hypothetical protein ABIH11_08230 [Candidatus Altiarchaeota archaeon]